MSFPGPAFQALHGSSNGSTRIKGIGLFISQTYQNHALQGLPGAGSLMQKFFDERKYYKLHQLIRTII